MPAEMIFRADDVPALLAMVRGTVAAEGHTSAMLTALATRLDEHRVQLGHMRADQRQATESIMATIDQLVARVREQSGTVASLTTFVHGLEQQIRDALAGVTLPSHVQAGIDAAFAGVDSNTQAIADAIDSDPNTPAAPTPAPAPAPAPAPEPEPDDGEPTDSAVR